MIGEEKDMVHKRNKGRKDKEIIKKAKNDNIERVKKGLEPKFMKKSMHYYIFANIIHYRRDKGVCVKGEVRSDGQVREAGLVH
jgi:hypothetical protein